MARVELNWTSSGKHALLWSLPATRQSRLNCMARLADCGASGGAGVTSDALNQMEPPPMPTEATETVSQLKRRQKTIGAATKPSALSGARRTSKVAAPPPPAKQPGAHQTKQEKVLTLLGRADGATISDLIEATGWQQHSVRGFLAGTVKKKLGLTLTSSKDEGDLRHYRIVPRRGR
jgi:Protein of unknown function (DUF3489)